MATHVEMNVEFPKSQRDLFPAEAQQVYVEAYKQSFAESAKGNNNQLSPDSVAARDAWEAVRRKFVQDSVTHKWHAVGEQAAAPAEKDSLLNSFKRLFKR